MNKCIHDVIQEIISTSKPDGIVTRIKSNQDLWSEIVEYTRDFLFVNKAEQIYFVAHKLEAKPICCCGNGLSFVSVILGYREFCSRTCTFARSAATERRVAKMQANGGVGLANPKSKAKAQLCLQNTHGAEITNPGQIKSFRARMREDNPMFDTAVVQKVSNTIQSKHGPHKTKASHIKMSSTQAHLVTSQDKLTDFVKGKTITQCARESGLNYTTIYNKVKKYDLFDSMVFNHRSEMEHDLGTWLNRENICFKHDDRTVLGGLELDFLFPQYNFALELNGLFHHSENSGKKDRSYHKKKFDMCAAQGITLIQVWQDEYWKCKNVVQSKILYLAHRHQSQIHARKCQIDFIDDAALEKQFLTQNHIQGFAPYRQLSVAAWHQGSLLAIMSFAYQNNYWELVRFATDVTHHSSGLFSRMLKFIIRTGRISHKVVSFSDNRLGNGKLYQSSGFKLEKTLAPDHMYTCDYQLRHHKQTFRKNNLIDRFKLDPAYVKSHTEWQIMQELGFDRLWDAGKCRWSLHI